MQRPGGAGGRSGPGMEKLKWLFPVFARAATTDYFHWQLINLLLSQ